MTITKLDRSTPTALAFKVSGDITKQDYEVLTPAVAAAVADRPTVNVLLDLTEFHWEKVSAWGSDLHFGHEFRHKIARLAIVGNRKWEEHLAHLSSPLYAQESAYFESVDDGWAWLTD